MRSVWWSPDNQKAFIYTSQDCKTPNLYEPFNPELWMLDFEMQQIELIPDLTIQEQPEISTNILSPSDFPNNYLAWSPDNQYFAIINEHALLVLSLADMSFVEVFNMDADKSNSIGQITWTLDNLLIFNTIPHPFGDDNIGEIYAYSPDNETLEEIISGDLISYQFFLSEDNHFLAV